MALPPGQKGERGEKYGRRRRWRRKEEGDNLEYFTPFLSLLRRLPTLISVTETLFLSLYISTSAKKRKRKTKKKSGRIFLEDRKMREIKAPPPNCENELLFLLFLLRCESRGGRILPSILGR